MKSKGSTVNLCGTELAIEGNLLRTAHLAEGYDYVEDPVEWLNAIRSCGTRVDLLTFVQRLSETSPKYHYPMEWDNFAVLPVSTYDDWFTNQIKGKTRNMIRKAEKLNVSVREVPFDDSLVRGISAINNESPVRQGMRYWHYGDDLETVRRKNGSFPDRSIFLGTFFENELIGYAKLVVDDSHGQGGLMQFLCMLRHRDKAPNNMLVAQAVRSCADRGIPYLWYAKFSYGRKSNDSLSEFKQRNGFLKVNVPRYYVALTRRGRAALRVGLHHGLKESVPGPVIDRFRKLRDIWHARRLEGVKERS